MRYRPRLATVLGVLGVTGIVAVLTGCSIQPDTTPREIPQDDRALSDPVTPAEGGEAAGSTRVFLVKEGDDGQPHLRSARRSIASTPTAVMQELLKGPNAREEAAGITTALPRGLIGSARSGAGVVTVDVSPQLLDEPAPQLMLAIAQIVFTQSELEGVREVRIRVDGTNRPWPDGQGELRTSALTVYDYPGLAESTQPAYPPIPSPASAS
jgi:spore germination protein GerM